MGRSADAKLNGISCEREESQEETPNKSTSHTTTPSHSPSADDSNAPAQPVPSTMTAELPEDRSEAMSVESSEVSEVGESAENVGVDLTAESCQDQDTNDALGSEEGEIPDEAMERSSSHSVALSNQHGAENKDRDAAPSEENSQEASKIEQSALPMEGTETSNMDVDHDCGTAELSQGSLPGHREPDADLQGENDASTNMEADSPGDSDSYEPPDGKIISNLAQPQSIDSDDEDYEPPEIVPPTTAENQAQEGLVSVPADQVADNDSDETLKNANASETADANATDSRTEPAVEVLVGHHSLSKPKLTQKAFS